MLKFEPFALGSLIALLAFLNGGSALAADTDADREARERYENAVKLYEDGAYDAALVELNRASELKPSYKIYYNIGQVRFAMHDYAAAMDAYRQYLEKGGDKIPAARRDQVQKELNTLAQRVAKLNIESDVPTAEVFVDDVLIGTTPLSAPVVVNSGIRRVSVRHPDYPVQSRRVSIAGGVQETVSFALQNRSAAGAPPVPAPPAAASGALGPASVPRRAEPSPSAPSSTVAPVGNNTAPHAATHRVPWVGWALTGAFTAGAAVTGVLALSNNSSLAHDRDQLDVSSSDVRSKASKVRTLATVTDGLIAAAVVAGGVSLWLTLGSSSEEPASARPKASSKALRVGVGLGGISMKATF